MSIRLMSLVWEADLGSPVRKLVMMRLADFSNDDGDNIFPSVARIANDCGVDRRTAEKTMAAFRAEGLLHVIDPGGWDGKKNRATHYKLQVDKLERLITPRPEATPPSRPVAGGVPASGRGGVPASGRDCPGVRPGYSLIEPSIEKPERLLLDKSSDSSKTDDLSKDFDEWYAAYPRHVGKGQALRAYRSARRKKIDPAALLDGARRACERYADTDQKFIPHPSTWLNGERWLDEWQPPEPEGMSFADCQRMLAEVAQEFAAEQAAARQAQEQGLFAQ